MAVKKDDFVMIAGGGNDDSYRNSSNLSRYNKKIYISDVESREFHQTDILCPEKGYFIAIAMFDFNGDRLSNLVCGFARRLCFDLPLDLVKIVILFHGNDEYLHLVDRYNKGYCKIAVNDIFAGKGF